MRTVKNFIQFCESIQAVPVGLHELVQITKVSEDDEICDEILTRQEASAILEYLEKYEYATIRHVIVLLLGKAGCGSAVSGHSTRRTGSQPGPPPRSATGPTPEHP